MATFTRIELIDHHKNNPFMMDLKYHPEKLCPVNLFSSQSHLWGLVNQSHL